MFENIVIIYYLKHKYITLSPGEEIKDNTLKNSKIFGSILNKLVIQNFEALYNLSFMAFPKPLLEIFSTAIDL